jgi:hypothetical protein
MLPLEGRRRALARRARPTLGEITGAGAQEQATHP